MNSIWLKWGSALLFLGVALGAFGAHAMKTKISSEAMEIYKTAVLYHLIHAIGILAVAALSRQIATNRIQLAEIFLISGIFLFSGSLYLLAATGQKWLGATAPLGGLSFLTAWAIVFCSITNKGG